ncbi:hypothetical protein BGZ47_010180 [Haplosporangium gracile]|nr:hypothetical protein BGZ47_010180 [Haplosporangium gracile]
MSTPTTPIPSTGLFIEYREPPSTTETTSPIPDDHDDHYTNDDDNNDNDDDGNCRNYHEEDMMVELLERRRELYARSKSLNPSSVRVSYPPPLLVDPTDHYTETTGAARSKSSSTPLYRRRPRRSSSRLYNKLAASEGDNYDKYDNINNTKRSTTNIATELWAWVLGLCRRLGLSCGYTSEETTTVAATVHRHYNYQVHHYIDKLTTTYYKNEAAIIKWISISLLMGLIMTVLPCCIIPRGDSTTPSQSLTDCPTTRYSDTMDLRTKYESFVQRITNLERSQSNRNVDFRLIQEQLRSGWWIEDKILNVIRNELPQELVLVKDPITGKIQIPEKFWNAVREVLGSRVGHVAAVVQEELRRATEGRESKWEEFLTENENRIKSLISDTNNNLSQRTAVLSRHEFLYLVATESNAIWSSLEGWVDSFVQRQLAQWVERETDGGDVQGIVSCVEQQILTEMINRAIERYHTRHHSLRHINTQPDYALYNSGGRIISHLTTQTYHRYKPTTILGQLFGLRNWVPPPLSSARNQLQANKVIQPEMNPGDCWPIKGAWGQIAIQLAKRVVVTEVMIEHVDPRVALHRGTAPREIEIWRLAAPISSSSCSSSKEAEGEARMEKGEDGGKTPILATWHKFGSPFPGASLLTTITYQQQQSITFNGGNDSDEGGGIGEAEREMETAQKFSIPLSKQNVPAYGVVVRVLSNWGHPDFTCLYRVRVHGRTV